MTAVGRFNLMRAVSRLVTGGDLDATGNMCRCGPCPRISEAITAPAKLSMLAGPHCPRMDPVPWIRVTWYSGFR